ncbi:MAG: hypothetical protein QOH90_1659 [Actinomycetota bacterium]|nr:hypothetical protein [Actinomycetota bacterium]
MSWLEEEPVRGGYPAIEFLGLSGVDRMRAAVKGAMPRPPIHHLFGLTPISSGVASSVFSMPASPRLQSGAGVFLAGTAALVSDAPLGSAVLSPLGPGQIAITSDLTLNYLRPVSVRSRQLVSRARPIEVGRRVGLSEAIIEDGHGEAVAHATSRCFIRQLPHSEGALPTSTDPPTYEGPDPHERAPSTAPLPPDTWSGHSFLDICDAMNRGELDIPPFAEFFGFTEMNAKEGYFETTAPSSPWFSSPAGTIYGGFLAYLVDSVLTGAISTVLESGFTCAPLDLKVNFLRPVLPDGRPIEASATVVHRGRNLMLAEGQIVNADGKLVVKATSSATAIEGKAWLASVIDDAPETD